jgi:hypothetical protein
VILQTEAGSAHVKLNVRVEPFWNEKGHSFYAESIVGAGVLVVTMLGKEKGQIENIGKYIAVRRASETHAKLFVDTLDTAYAVDSMNQVQFIMHFICLV